MHRAASEPPPQTSATWAAADQRDDHNEAARQPFRHIYSGHSPVHCPLSLPSEAPAFVTLVPEAGRQAAWLLHAENHSREEGRAWNDFLLWEVSRTSEAQAEKHKQSWLFHLERGRKWGGGGRAEGETKKQVGGGIEKTPDVGEQGRQESMIGPLCS